MIQLDTTPHRAVWPAGPLTADVAAHIDRATTRFNYGLDSFMRLSAAASEEAARYVITGAPDYWITECAWTAEAWRRRYDEALA